MARDTRTTTQVQGALSAESKLAQQIENDPMSTPQERHLANVLHEQMNRELTELDNRRG